MAQANMGKLVRENHISIYLHILLRGYDMAKPAKWRREFAHNGEGNIFLDNAHTTAMNQAPHRVDTHSQSHQHKCHANDEDCHGNILKE